MLDHNHNGLISISEATKDPVFNFLTRNFTLLLNTDSATNGTTQQQSNPQQYNTINKNGYMDINNQLKPKLIAQAQALSTIIPVRNVPLLRDVLYGSIHNTP